MDQTEDRGNISSDFDVAHCCDLAEPFTKYNSDDARGTITLFNSSDVNRKGAAIPAAAHSIHRKKLLKDAYCRLMLYVRSWGASVKARKAESVVGWDVGLLRMYYVPWVGDKAI